jgi:hypothetical protein
MRRHGIIVGNPQGSYGYLYVAAWLKPVEHERAEDCTLQYVGHVAAPGYGVSYTCTGCGRPWLKLGAGYVDPREQVYELRPEDVV